MSVEIGYKQTRVAREKNDDGTRTDERTEFLMITGRWWKCVGCVIEYDCVRRIFFFFPLSLSHSLARSHSVTHQAEFPLVIA